MLRLWIVGEGRKNYHRGGKGMKVVSLLFEGEMRTFEGLKIQFRERGLFFQSPKACYYLSVSYLTFFKIRYKFSYFARDAPMTNSEDMMA